MNDQDREAFEGERRAASRWDDEEIPYCHPGDRPDYCTGIAMHFFQAGLAHARKQTAELVEAVERLDIANIDLNEVGDLAAQLKEQDDD